MPPRRYHLLDGLRGIGALWVVLLHFAPDYGVPAPAHGYLAVDLFFCLSGFVLSRSYGARIGRGMGFGAFVAVRLIRLYPLYALSILLGALGALRAGMPGHALGGAGYAAAIVSGMLMLPSPTWGEALEMFPLNFVGWSLFVELLLSFAFFFAPRWRSRTLVACFVLALAALIGARLLSGHIGGGFAWRDAPMGLMRGVLSFSAGMLIARHVHRPPVTTGWAWALPAATILLLSIDPPHPVFYDLVAMALVIPAITLGAVLAEPRACRLCGIVGDISYAVYALHIVSFFLIASLARIDPAHPASPLAGAAAFALFIGACWLVDRFYDPPLRVALNRRRRRHADAAAHASPR